MVGPSKGFQDSLKARVGQLVGSGKQLHVNLVNGKDYSGFVTKVEDDYFVIGVSGFVGGNQSLFAIKFEGVMTFALN